MVRREQQPTPTTDRDALTAFYNRTRGPVHRSKRNLIARAAALIALVGLPLATASTFVGGSNEATNSTVGGDRATSAPDAYSTDGSVPEAPETSGAPMDGGVGLECTLDQINALPVSGGVRRVILGLTVTGADIRNISTTVVSPLIKEGAIVPASDAIVTRTPDGAIVAEIPASSTVTDVYGVYVNAGGKQDRCGGFYVEDPIAHFAADSQLPREYK